MASTITMPCFWCNSLTFLIPFSVDHPFIHNKKTRHICLCICKENYNVTVCLPPCQILFLVLLIDFWIHMSHMDLCNESCSAGRQSCVAKTFIGHYMQFFNQSFSYLPCFRHHWLLLLCITFSDLDMCLEITRSAQSKTSWVYLLTLFSWSGWNLICVEVIQVEHPNTTFEWELMKQGKLLLFYWLLQKTLTLAYICNGYLREMTVIISCMVNMDHLSICSFVWFGFFALFCCCLVGYFVLGFFLFGKE